MSCDEPCCPSLIVQPAVSQFKYSSNSALQDSLLLKCTCIKEKDRKSLATLANKVQTVHYGVVTLNIPLKSTFGALPYLQSHRYLQSLWTHVRISDILRNSGRQYADFKQIRHHTALVQSISANKTKDKQRDGWTKDQCVDVICRAQDAAGYKTM